MIIPKKSLGQNFLINQGVLEKIVSAAELGPDNTVLEIGPGTGNLTKLLSEKAGRVIAIEKDRQLIEMLKTELLTLPGYSENVEIIEADVLKFSRSVREVEGRTLNNYKIVANIPYYITSNLLRTIFEKWPRPELIVLTVQKEVAKRIVAKPPNMSLLALSVQFYSELKIVGYISRGSFRPMPKVDSAIIRLNPKSETLNPKQKEEFFKLVKAGFSGKRKQLINNLAKNFGMIREDILVIFEKMNFKPDIRAENLSLSQWIELSKLIGK